MRKTTITAAGALLAASLLTGCGGGDSEGSSGDYCDAMKDAASDIKSLTSGSAPDFSKFEEAIEVIKNAGKDAPSEVKDDWKVMTGGLDDLTSALDDAGIKFEDLAGLMTGEIPEGLDEAKLTELGEKLQGFSSTKMEEAMEAIEKHAKSECDVDLSAP